MKKGPITNTLFCVEAVSIVERDEDGETIEREISALDYLLREKKRLEEKGDHVRIVKKGPRCWLTREGKRK